MKGTGKTVEINIKDNKVAVFFDGPKETVVIVDTKSRRVIIHHFFNNGEDRLASQIVKL